MVWHLLQRSSPNRHARFSMSPTDLHAQFWSEHEVTFVQSNCSMAAMINFSLWVPWWHGVANLLPVCSRGLALLLCRFVLHPLADRHPFGCQSLATVQLRHSWGQPTARVCLCCSKGSHQGMLPNNCHTHCAKEAPQPVPMWLPIQIQVNIIMIQQRPVSMSKPSVVL